MYSISFSWLFHVFVSANLLILRQEVMNLNLISYNNDLIHTTGHHRLERRKFKFKNCTFKHGNWNRPCLIRLYTYRLALSYECFIFFPTNVSHFHLKWAEKDEFSWLESCTRLCFLIPKNIVFLIEVDPTLHVC